MRKPFTLHLLACIAFVLLAAPALFGTGAAEVDLVFEHQDPAGDVMKYNATLNGVSVEDEPGTEALDIKWVYSKDDGGGNLVLTMDLKAKIKFLNNDDTKYVFRLLTSQDNSTGYNITYQNNSCELVPFTQAGNGTSGDIMDKVSFVKESGDEMLTIAVPITEYLDNITYFNIDAYSMMVLDNATYLDYISEVPGHPEYISAEVEEGEDLETTGEGGKDDDKEDEGGIATALLLIITVVFVLLVVVMVMLSRKRMGGEE